MNSFLWKPRWATKVSWGERKVYVNLARDAIRSAPPFVSLEGVTLEYAARLNEHYRRFREGGSLSSGPLG